ncbi:MAG: ATP-binding protein [Bacteroidales bacterium]|nr:ATP-binding protein [Bacteroidales bacterium]
MENATIETLYEISERLVKATKTDFIRYLYNEINWNNNLIGIKGARGVGKTTLMLQYIKQNFKNDLSKALYVSLDNLWFANHTLSQVVDYHYKNGGTHIFIDEIHKYPNWQTLLKNIVDEYPGFNVVYTGSSMLKIDYHKGDLSRRQIVYTLKGLSFREFLEYETQQKFPALTLEQLLQTHSEVALQLTEKLKILPLFDKYLKCGYYPFYKKDTAGFGMRLQGTILSILNEDMPYVEDISQATKMKIMRMLMIIAENVPQTPKMSDLYAALETSREQGLKMLSLLESADLLTTLSAVTKNFKYMSKPDKIYLNNPNLMYALTPNANRGTLRETFFLNQMSYVGEVNYPKQGDFLVNQKYLFEVGGHKKTFDQIKDIPESFLAVDDIETGRRNRIPLYMFGMMY